ncbi:ExbD/TolR family protein [Achromobacter sp. Root565]|uniref:ExbD/TolR family protein n=1 Tax=Achromobacter sp. Root565 TaxID=1736564 RepID=UPI000AC56DEA
MSEINMVPLIDVMLVLLVIFIITAPLLAHSIKINMPQVAAEQIEEEPKTVDLAIDAAGALFWDEKPVNIDDLPNRFKSIAGTKPQPEIRIRADQNTRYETLAKVMASARRSGMTRIGFVTTPPSGGAAGRGSARRRAGSVRRVNESRKGAHFAPLFFWIALESRHASSGNRRRHHPGPCAPGIPGRPGLCGRLADRGRPGSGRAGGPAV